jgi:hypothetical protein
MSKGSSVAPASQGVYAHAERGPNNTVTSEAQPLRHARQSEAEPPLVEAWPTKGKRQAVGTACLSALAVVRPEPRFGYPPNGFKKNRISEMSST